MYYKSARIIDGKLKWVIIDENNQIVDKNPTKEELKDLNEIHKRCGNYNSTDTCEICGKDFHGKAFKEYKERKWTGRWICTSCHGYIINYGTTDKDKIEQIRAEYNKPKKYYNRTNTCDNIKEDGKKCENELYSGNTYVEYNKEGNPTGRYLCRNCWCKYERKNNPYCSDNIKKSLANRRIEDLDPNSPCAKGDIFQTITCKVHGVKDLNIENDNYLVPIDHPGLQSKGAIYNPIDRSWSNRWNMDEEKRKDYQYMIFYCMDKGMQNLVRGYKIPKEEIIKRSSISISSQYIHGWYEKYRIKDIGSYQEAYRNLRVKDVPGLRNERNVEFVYELF